MTDNSGEFSWNEFRKGTAEHIKRAGRSIVGVFCTEGDDGAPFAYAIGNDFKGLPELLVIGTSRGGFLNDLSRRVTLRVWANDQTDGRAHAGKDHLRQRCCTYGIYDSRRRVFRSRRLCRDAGFASGQARQVPLVRTAVRSRSRRVRYCGSKTPTNFERTGQYGKAFRF
jgi:hypothetical protein